MSIIELPICLVEYLTQYLEYLDILHLAITCKKFVVLKIKKIPRRATIHMGVFTEDNALPKRESLKNLCDGDVIEREKEGCIYIYNYGQYFTVYDAYVGVYNLEGNRPIDFFPRMGGKLYPCYLRDFSVCPGGDKYMVIEKNGFFYHVFVIGPVENKTGAPENLDKITYELKDVIYHRHETIVNQGKFYYYNEELKFRGLHIRV